MLTRLLLVCVLLSVGSVWSRSFDSDFYSELQIDEIVYTSVAIPRGASSVEIQLWCEESDTIKPVIYLKYDGLPTLTDYDWSSPLPSLPDALRIHDIQPTQSVLYIGIHGGKLLNSYYYFASSPTYILVGVDVMIEKCSNSLLSGLFCDSVYDTLPLSLIDLSYSSIDVPVNDGVEYALHIPSNLEGVTLSFSLPSIPSELCDAIDPTRRSAGHVSPYSLSGQQTVSAVSDNSGKGGSSISSSSSRLELLIDVYLDQPQEDENSAQHLLLLDYKEVCEGVQPGAQLDLPVTLQDMAVQMHYPLGGLWKVAAQVLLTSRPQNTSTSSTSGEETRWSHERHFSRRRASASASGSASGSAAGRGLAFSTATYQSREQLISERRLVIDATSDSKGDDDDILSGVRLSLIVSSKVDECVDGKTGFYDTGISGSSSGVRGSSGRLYGRRHVEDIDYSCRSDVTPLRGTRTSSVSLGYRSYTSSQVALPKQNSSSSVPPADYLLFAADMSDVSQLPSVGGVMQVQLRLVLPQSLSNNSSASISGGSTETDVSAILGAFKDLNYLVSLRVGGRPTDPNEDLPTYHNGTEEARNQQVDVSVLDYGYTSVISSSAYVLSSRYAVIGGSSLTTTSITNGGSDGEDSISNDDKTYSAPTRRTSTGLRISTSPDLSLSQESGEYQFVWTLPKPALPGLLGTGGGDSEGGSGSKQLYVHVTYERDTQYKELNDERLQQLFNQLEGISVKLLFLPCSASSCSHGTCITHRGDLDSSTCFCKFPWGGERCDQLIMSRWFYSLQVSLLVLSNAAMLPGILYCYRCGLTVLMTALCFASLSSAFYHLCDTDTYCIAEMSFQSLQVMDILFCTVCMAAMLLFYAPVTRQTHSSLLVLSAALLVTPVANQPTNALNIVCALAGAIALCLLLWVNHGMVSYNLTPQSLWQRCCARTDATSSSTGGPVSKRKRLRRRTKYLIVPPEEQQDSTQGSARGDTETGIEMSSSRSEGTFATKNVYALNRQQPDVESTFVGLESRYSSGDFREWELCITNWVLDLPANLYDCRYCLVGLVLALSGLGFFVLQTRESYWLMHSMWHLLVMLSSYFLVRGRFDFMNVVEYADPENPPFLLNNLYEE